MTSGSFYIQYCCDKTFTKVFRQAVKELKKQNKQMIEGIESMNFNKTFSVCKGCIYPHMRMKIKWTRDDN